MSGQSIDISKIRPDLRKFFDSEKLLVYFYSPNCTACKYQTPVIENLKNKKVNTLSIDVSKDLNMARIFGVMGTPSIAVMKRNFIAEFFVGYQDESKLLQSYHSIK